MSGRNIAIGVGIIVFLILGAVAGSLYDDSPPGDEPTDPVIVKRPPAPKPSPERSTAPATTAPSTPQSRPDPNAEVAPSPRRIADQFVYPGGAAGQSAARVLAPASPTLLPIPQRDGPVSRVAAPERAEFPLPPVKAEIPSVALPPVPPVGLAEPPLTVPASLGRGAEPDLTKIPLVTPPDTP